MSSLKNLLDAIDTIHSDCFFIYDHHGHGFAAYFQAIATRQDDNTWKLERKAEPQLQSIASGKDLQPPEIVPLEDVMAAMSTFNNMYREFSTVSAPTPGMHYRDYAALAGANTAGRMKAIRKMRGPSPS